MENKKYIDYQPEDFKYYWESKEEFKEWSKEIIKQFEEYETLKYENIMLSYNISSYMEYGESFDDVCMSWSYQRDYTQEELDEINKNEKDKNELYKIKVECFSFIKENTNFNDDIITNMVNNIGILELYKNGNLKF